MGNSWLVLQAGISVWSAVAATAGAFIAWRVFRWQRQAEVPVVLCQVRPNDEVSEWIELEIEVRNITETRWVSERLVIKAPKGALGISDRKFPTVEADYGPVPDLEAAKAVASNPLPLGATAYPVGTGGSTLFTIGDVSRETVHILKSSLRGRTLSLVLHLVSQDAKPRKITVPIRRHLPLAIRAG